MTSVFYTGHQRSSSQAQELLPNDEVATSTALLTSCKTASPYDVDLVECPIATPLQGINNQAGPEQGVNTSNINGTMRFSTLSDCSSYYGLPGTYTENETRFLCKNPYLRKNIQVILGAIVLALVGLALLIFGLFVMLYPNNMGKYF